MFKIGQTFDVIDCGHPSHERQVAAEHRSRKLVTILAEGRQSLQCHCRVSTDERHDFLLVLVKKVGSVHVTRSFR